MICLRVIFTFALAGTLLAQQPAEEHKNRDLGYDDTPQIPGQKWRVHDNTRPHPPKVAPAGKPGQPPADAIVLFNGKDLSQWVMRGRNGTTGEPQWKVKDGYLEVVPRKGGIMTKEKFGDIQLHVEWMEPKDVEGTSQSRGNSGIELMTRYELQVLESNQGVTYADGQAAAIYGTWPPLVNATRKPGEWQTYDIVMIENYLTVVHNDQVIMDNAEVEGITGGALDSKEWEPGPIYLQGDHSQIFYRNIVLTPAE